MIIAGPNGQSLNPTAPKLGGAARGWSEPHTRVVVSSFLKDQFGGGWHHQLLFWLGDWVWLPPLNHEITNQQRNQHVANVNASTHIWGKVLTVLLRLIHHCQSLWKGNSQNCQRPRSKTVIPLELHHKFTYLQSTWIGMLLTFLNACFYHIFCILHVVGIINLYCIVYRNDICH